MKKIHKNNKNNIQNKKINQEYNLHKTNRNKNKQMINNRRKKFKIKIIHI
jgi:hypothetical protein